MSRPPNPHMRKGRPSNGRPSQNTISAATKQPDRPQRYAQLAVFADPTSRHGDPTTSVAAAQSVRERRGDVEAAILAAYRAHGGLIDDELVQLMPERHAPSVITARSRLARCGRVVPTGEQRLSRRKRAQQVWTTA